MKKLSKFIRVITVAPIFAAISVTLLYFFNSAFFKNPYHYIASLISLTVFPLLAYPISLIKKKEERRKFQRSLAIVFAIIGYIAGIVFALITKAPGGEIIIYLTYLLSGIVIAFCSFVLKRKSSGHTCGVAGPVSLLIYYISPLFSFAYLLLIPVFWASLKMKRHTASQLISGCIIPIICMVISISVISI